MKMAKAINDDYYEILKGFVSWGMKEARDDKISKILSNVCHGRKY
jgi:hypothetical protein